MDMCMPSCQPSAHALGPKPVICDMRTQELQPQPHGNRIMDGDACPLIIY